MVFSLRAGAILTRGDFAYLRRVPLSEMGNITIYPPDVAPLFARPQADILHFTYTE